MQYKKGRIFTLILSIMLFLSALFPTTGTFLVKAQDDYNYANIVLFAYFSDDTEGASYFETNRDKIISLYDGNKNRTLTNYLKAVSYNNLRLKNYFPQDNGTKITAYELSITEAYAASQGNMDTVIIGELIQNVPGLQDVTVDYDGDGCIDNLTVILRVSDEADVSGSSFVSHHSTYPTSASYSGKTIGHYNVVNTQSLLGKSDSLLAQEAGVLAHEFLHGLGYPDLYTVDGSYPVGNWDIMGGVDYGMSYPLAYLRMYFTRWLTIDTVTTSQTITLDTQDKGDGHPAYILKSPLSNQEVFVVEYRKKDYADDTYDRFIGGSGVIVYRINKAVSSLSNLYYSEKGVYVFRPQGSESDYGNAYLSSESGRTAIGASDMTKGLTDGALTFSDGSNSGIVISEVGSAAGSQITLKVSFPEINETDIWEDSAFDTVSGNAADQIAMTVYNGKPYVLTYRNSAFTLYTQQSGVWKQLYTKACAEGSYGNLALCEYNGRLYYGYIDQSSTLHIVQMSTDFTTDYASTTISGCSMSFDMTGGMDGLYVGYIKNDKTAYLCRYTAGSLTTKSDMGSYYSSTSFVGQPDVEQFSGYIYASIRDAGTNEIKTFRLDGADTYTLVSDGTAKGSAYGVTAGADCLHVVTNKLATGISVHSYDGSTWTQTTKEMSDVFDVVPICKKGTMFILTSSSGSGSTRIVRYEIATNTFAQEGVTVDGNSTSQSLGTDGVNLYVAYLRNSDSKFIVRKKQVQITEVEEPAPTEPTTTEQTTTGETTTEQPTTTEKPTTTEQPATTEQPVTPDVTVSYHTHIQTFGWESTWRTNGVMSGTSGKSKRLEGIEIKVSGNQNLGIQYTTHCQSYGWLPWSANGDMSGTEGESKRLEAIKIQLTGADKDKYDIYYRVHAQSYGWLGWAKNGDPAGTAGYGKRLEAIQIVVVKKGENINTTMGNIVSRYSEAYIARPGTSSTVAGADATNVEYRTHVQTYGWQGFRYNGQMSGTSGQAKRLEGINIKLTNMQYDGSIVYTTHVQTYGWQGNINNSSTWKKDGEMAGTSGQAKRLEAICIKLTGEMEKHYDVYYRVHAQTFGWLGWTCNGAPSGTAGLSRRLEGIQIVLVPKGSGAPAGNYGGIQQNRSEAYIAR